jgi:hypothetical protein
MTPLSPIPLPYRLAAGAAALALAAAGVLWFGSHKFDAGVASQQAKQAVIDLEREHVATAASEDFRRVETEYREIIAIQKANYDALQQKHAQALGVQRDLLADAGRLRNDIAAYAAGSGGTAPDTAASASARAAALGGLLAEALRADAECAEGAESASDAVRTLLASWPRKP